MCIQSSVGTGGVNAPADVRLVQILLNAGLGRLNGGPRLAIDGIAGPHSAEAIHRFQRHGVGWRRTTGRIDPGDATLECLRDLLPAHLSPDTLHAAMPAASAADIGRFHAPLLAAMRVHGIGSPLRRAHFLAQIGEESCDLAVLDEGGAGGRGGSSEAVHYRGRGLLKLAGRPGYARYRAARGVDVIAEPDRLAADPAIAADAACWFWAASGLNAHADINDLVAITGVIAGGRNRLPHRAQRLARAKWLLAR